RVSMSRSSTMSFSSETKRSAAENRAQLLGQDPLDDLDVPRAELDQLVSRTQTTLELLLKLGQDPVQRALTSLLGPHVGNALNRCADVVEGKSCLVLPGVPSQ